MTEDTAEGFYFGIDDLRNAIDYGTRRDGAVRRKILTTKAWNRLMAHVYPEIGPDQIRQAHELECECGLAPVKAKFGLNKLVEVNELEPAISHLQAEGTLSVDETQLLMFAAKKLFRVFDRVDLSDLERADGGPEPTCAPMEIDKYLV